MINKELDSATTQCAIHHNARRILERAVDRSVGYRSWLLTSVDWDEFLDVDGFGTWQLLEVSRGEGYDIAVNRFHIHRHTASIILRGLLCEG